MICIVGCGGIGCNVLNLLSRLVDSVIIFDDDVVEEKNLERQILFFEKDVGRKKIEVAVEKLGGLCEIDGRVEKFVSVDCDLVIDASDNFEARFAINKFCRSRNIPWIHIGVAGDIGMVKMIVGDEFEKMFSGKAESKTGVNSALVAATAALAVNIVKKFLSGEKDTNMYRLNFGDNSLISI